jgi:hypothetical protein
VNIVSKINNGRNFRQHHRILLKTTEDAGPEVSIEVRVTLHRYHIFKCRGEGF